MSDLTSILARYPAGVCPVDERAAAQDALAQMVVRLRPLVTLMSPDGVALASSFDGTEMSLVVYDAPVGAAESENCLGVRWLWQVTE